MSSVCAHAKINLALVVGPLRADGKHEVATVLQQVSLADRLTLEEFGELRVDGFAADTLVRRALELLAERAGVRPRWRVVIEKHIPVAAGLGGGSSDAAAALELANAGLTSPLPADELEQLASAIGADVPFFLRRGPHLGRGDGTSLEPLPLPGGYPVLLALPRNARKTSTAAVYGAFDRRDGPAGFEARLSGLLHVLPRIRRVDELRLLPRNDLVQSSLAERLLELGAVRADVTGAGPCLYGIFTDEGVAGEAAEALTGDAECLVTSAEGR